MRFDKARVDLQCPAQRNHCLGVLASIKVDDRLRIEFLLSNIRVTGAAAENGGKQ
jgi:hypothetical protein